MRPDNALLQHAEALDTARDVFGAIVVLAVMGVR